MKTLIGLSGIAMFMIGFSGFMAESVPAQYLPPVIDQAFLSEPIPDFVYPEKKPELKPIQENQSSQFIYRQYEEEDDLQLPACAAAVSEQYQIVIAPVADQRPGAQPPRVALPTATEPQQVPGMTAQTIYYFPPPTFPDPVPFTVYRPAVPPPQFPSQLPLPDTAGYPQHWSPYNAMYGPPMITQPHYFGPPKQEKGRRVHKKNPGVPGEPVVGPPTLVYPNGIVVRPKVYLPGQPFKNAVRAMTP